MVLKGAPVIICDYINKIDLNECNMLKMFKFNENDANNCNCNFFFIIRADLRVTHVFSVPSVPSTSGSPWAFSGFS